MQIWFEIQNSIKITTIASEANRLCSGSHRNSTCEIWLVCTFKKCCTHTHTHWSQTIKTCRFFSFMAKVAVLVLVAMVVVVVVEKRHWSTLRACASCEASTENTGHAFSFIHLLSPTKRTLRFVAVVEKRIPDENRKKNSLTNTSIKVDEITFGDGR